MVILEADAIKQTEKKVRKEFLRRTRKFIENKLLQKTRQKNKHLVSSPCKTLGTILKMNKEGTHTNRRKTRKLMIMHKAFNQREDITMST